MNKIKVVSPKNLPTHLPLVSIVVTYLLLDKCQAPGWVWGAVATFWGISLIACVFLIVKEEKCSPFEKENRWTT